MLPSRKNKLKTVTEKINEFIANDNNSDSNDDIADEATIARVVDFDEQYELPDARSTEFRKRNIKLLSEQSARYSGKITSRNELKKEIGSEFDSKQEVEGTESNSDEELAYEQSDDSGMENEVSMADISMNGVRDSECDGGDDDDNQGEGNVENKDDNGYDDQYQNETENEDNADNISEADEDQSDDEPSVLEINHAPELQKGKSVQNQLQIWECLLNLRIHTQKVLNQANQLPTPNTLQVERKENTELATALQTTQRSSERLLHRLLELQDALCNQFSEIQQVMKMTRKRLANQDSSDGEPQSKRHLAEHLQTHFQEFRKYRNETLLKWDDRTKLLLSGRAKKRTMQDDYNILRKIDNTLANRNTLVVRTQILRSNNKNATIQQNQLTNGLNMNKNRNVHIYDDSDFYYQQLRELIEYKADTTTNMQEITKQFIELQKIRQKIKKNVDTRASKGRKIRYVVHNKLVNFMAPEETSNWADESKNNLYKSLFME